MTLIRTYRTARARENIQKWEGRRTHHLDSGHTTHPCTCTHIIPEGQDVHLVNDLQETSGHPEGNQAFAHEQGKGGDTKDSCPLPRGEMGSLSYTLRHSARTEGCSRMLPTPL